MILLEPGNRILGQTCLTQLNWKVDTNTDGEESRRRGAVDVRLWDFDDVCYRVQVNPEESATELRVSMNLPCYDEIRDHGGKAALDAAFPGMSVDPTDGFNISVSVDMSKYSTAEEQEAMANQLKLIKSVVVGGAFRHQFQPISEGKESHGNFQFSIRADTSVYIVPSSDRVVVIFSLDFAEPVDKCIARVFMQEFVDVRKRAGLGSAPPCTFGVDPPREMAQFGITEPTGNLGFLSFAIMRNHLENGKMEKIIPVLQSFRNYVQYHIKCAKTYFHQCMRARVRELLKVLNRAKVEDPNKERKTAQGRTFTQK